MTLDKIAAAIERVQTVLRRRPDVGLHEDTLASASWKEGTRVVSTHPNGMQVTTDMPQELGGEGREVTPGWLFRAGIASCATTSIALAAAERGIELSRLDIRLVSRSDTRGLFGMPDSDGTVVSACPTDMRMEVQIAARGASAEALRALVEKAVNCSPIPNAVRAAVPLTVQIEVEPK
ncbi:MAG TPA: OsmC family protein [Steroidobacteraceae bacterium]|jgi:uncharacterized OsmC-like protein